MTDYKITHLQIVQDIIKRQAQSSLLIKGWSITLVSVVFAIVHTKDINPQLSLFAMFPAILFWSLDSLYLRQERLLRHLHNAIAEDIRNNTSHVLLFDINLSAYCDKEDVSWWCVARSRTVWPIPITAILLAFIVAIFVQP